MTKETARKQALENRGKIQNRDQLDKMLAAHFFARSLEGVRAVCAYASFGSEVGTAQIIKELITRQIAVYLPVSYKDGTMTFYLHTGSTRQGLYGISEPVRDKKLEGCPDLVLVPGVAFDKAGTRVGYGKGYYDRFFKNVSCPKVGLCYSQQVFEQIEAEPHDERMDFLLTQTGWHPCGENGTDAAQPRKWREP